MITILPSAQCEILIVGGHTLDVKDKALDYIKNRRRCDLQSVGIVACNSQTVWDDITSENGYENLTLFDNVTLYYK